MALADLKIYSERVDPDVGGNWIQEDVLINIFRSASNKISKGWNDGLRENLSSDLDRKLTEIEGEIDRVWIGCRIGENSIEEFKSVVSNWIQMHKHVVESNKMLGGPEVIEQVRSYPC